MTEAVMNERTDRGHGGYGVGDALEDSIGLAIELGIRFRAR
jgi:hypothetical protein